MPRILLALVLSLLSLEAQVYSPQVLAKGQPDPTDLKRLAAGIYAHYDAQTPRERAEAIWKFFLTDGRFVKPGFWYHIAGWAYEEPAGEVLDPLKLLNSYGFGLCYQIAPVLEAVWKAGGFEDARVWFLTGHTVAEVFYDGAYHYYDSDMMGYNTAGRTPAGKSKVASVRDLERNPSIILGKMLGPKEPDAASVSSPWYPADVRAGAMDGLAELFSTTSDNYLFTGERAPAGHSMEFALRPGERLIRLFRPEQAGVYYLPYKQTSQGWEEFPREIAEYQIRTADGPRSQKDARLWGTGALEYHPTLNPTGIYEVQSPWVMIDAGFRLDATVGEGQWIRVATSTDDGRTWQSAGERQGPFQGEWRVEASALTTSAHGRRSAVASRYGYRLQVTTSEGARVKDLVITTRIQLNPRTLPELKPGRNELEYTAGAARLRHAIPTEPDKLRGSATAIRNARFVAEGGQGYWVPDGAGPAEFVFEVEGAADAGARFLDLSNGLAPDKLTAEVRKVKPMAAKQPKASIEWCRTAEGQCQTLWSYDNRLTWKDGDAVDRLLRWPEVDRYIAPAGLARYYIRYRVEDMAVDSFRLATWRKAAPAASPLTITHYWHEGGAARSRSIQVPAGADKFHYEIELPAEAAITNDAVLFSVAK